MSLALYELQLKTNNEKRTIIYCRESRDDYMQNYERIETQRDLLIKFCKKNGYTNIIDIVMHDDMSGTDFARFDDIRQKIINNEVDVLVMKDSSRLGRNQIESLKFVELLADYSVELVFEGKNYDADFFPLEAWFNERRAKDDSSKIRRNLKHKMEEGTLLVREHFGYKKVNKKLIVNENTAWIIKKIFEFYLEGYGYRTIAAKLNEENIMTPSKYKNNPNLPISELWNALHIERVLKNQVYTGCMVSSVSEKINFKSKKTRKKPKEEWIITPNTHEAIIDEERFNLVQEIIKKRNQFAPKTRTPSLFSGFVLCGKCKSPMFMLRKPNRPPAFLCGKYISEGKNKGNNNIGCEGHRIREEELITIFKKHIENMINNEEYKNYIYSKYKDAEFLKNNIENTIKKLEGNLSKLQSQYKEVYNDKLNGIIPEFIFKDKSKELLDNIDIIQKQINSLKKETSQFLDTETNINKIEEIYKLFLTEGFTKEKLEMILNKIIIFNSEEIKEEEKALYNIDDNTFEEIYNNGGIVIDYKFNVQHVFTSRWIDQLIVTIDLFSISLFLNGLKRCV